MKIFRDIRALTICGGFGAISFVVMWALGSVLLIASGMPLVGGIASSIMNAFVLIIGIRLVDMVGTATIISLIVTSLAIPTVILGPPGVYKILLGLYMGVIFEGFVFIFRYHKLAYLFGLAITFAASVPLEYYIFKVLGFPAADQIRPMMYVIMLVYFINGLLGSWLGQRFYDRKISKLKVVRMWKERNNLKSDGF